MLLSLKCLFLLQSIKCNAREAILEVIDKELGDLAREALEEMVVLDSESTTVAKDVHVEVVTNEIK